VARIILPGIHNYAAVLYGRADCGISGLKHIFCYQKMYMYDSSHLFLSSFTHVNSVPNLNFLHLLNSSHIHLASPQQKTSIPHGRSILGHRYGDRNHLCHNGMRKDVPQAVAQDKGHVLEWYCVRH